MSDSIFEVLNDKQKEAVLHEEGPLLILAGAGAGKTKVLTHRIAHLIEDCHVAPYNIMAITFTNKAAEEMKHRVENLVPYGDSVWVATFHSSCVRILRRHIDLLGYDTDFSIYDTDDQRTVVRHVVKELGLDPKMYKERAMLSLISACKNDMRTASDALKEARDFRQMQEARIYEAYEKRLKQNNALDFDDLLLKTVELFKTHPDVLENYQNRFRYIMVDEYQDTNTVQFELVYLLAKAHQNLCVVGDDDQSIYKFRGADIRNILEFEHHFPGTKVVKLEQNYRSTTHILDVANAVIAHNIDRKAKHLWSDLGTGDEVSFNHYETGNEEAEEVIRKIVKLVKTGDFSYKDFAVLYRTNAQSRLFEEQCVNRNVPYKMVGGVNFYQRAEIKDLLAYLKTIVSGKDDIATARIINVPKRGIGDTTIEKVMQYGALNGLSLMESVHHCMEIPGIERAKGKLAEFDQLIGKLREFAGILSDGRMTEEGPTFEEILREIIDRTGYYETLDDFDEDQKEQKKENINEMFSKVVSFEENYEGEGRPSLVEFLEEVALVADVDDVNDSDDKVLLMTIHASKGLEFPVVFLTGLEDGLFPSYMSMDSGDSSDVEEERRLFYVGATRAMRQLYLSAAKCRMMRGETQWNALSKFVREIPNEMIGLSRKVEKVYQRPLELFAPEKPKFETTASFGKTFEVKKDSSLGYEVGDRVRHFKYGEGTVLEIIDGKKDFEVAVNFDESGEKHMYASFAKLQKV